MKDLFSDNKQSKKRILEFFNKKGFYLILVVGIAIVGVTVIWIAKPNLGLFNFITNTEDTEENFIPDDFEDYLTDYDGDEGIDEDKEAIDVNNETGEEGEGQGINPDENINMGEDASLGEEDAAIDTNDTFNEEPGFSNEESRLAMGNDLISENEAPGTWNMVYDADKANVNANEVIGTSYIEAEENESSVSFDDEDENAVFLAKNEGKNGDKENSKDTDEGKATLDDGGDKPDFIMPVYGNIIHDYAMDQLVYSKTLEDWRTHSGIDIATSRGTPVKAVAAGIVHDIRKDPKLGYTIVIDHENGFKTLYANLASPDMVLPNQIVEQGESLGSVGDTSIFEIALEPHLHFEVLKNDEVADPKLYLPDY